MYKLLLISKYLRRKLAPLFAAMAVTLCTAMVIIVISVMGGFLELMRQAAQRLTGQVMIVSDLSGFPNHEQLLVRLGRLEQVRAATGVIRAYGLVNLYGQVTTVEVLGIDPEGLDAVADYRNTLYWTTQHLVDNLNKNPTPLSEMTPRDRAQHESELQKAQRIDLRQLGMAFKAPPTARAASLPGIVLGIEVNPYNQRDANGQYQLANCAIGSELTLTVLPLTRRGTVMEPAVRRLVVANEFKSGLYEVDANRVYVPFGLLQEMLRMDTGQLADPNTGQPTGQTIPSRTGEIMVRGHTGVALEQLYQAVSSTVQQFVVDHPDTGRLRVLSWRQRHATLLGAVEKEKFMLTFLFAFISLVAVAMIGVIFYMIVLEKTRDIGVLRAIGASQRGVVSIFLGYGLAIGCLGAVLGTALAASIVYHLNEIQDFLATNTGVTLVCAVSGLCGLVAGGIAGAAWGWRRRSELRWGVWGAVILGPPVSLAAYASLKTWPALEAWVNARVNFRMWDPTVYYFDRIPSQLDGVEVTVIVIVAVLSSLVGSLIPAFLAGRLNPVESLRYE